MLDIHNGLVRAVLDTRHEELVREQRMHRLATEVRSARTEREVRPRRRLRLRAVPATR
ncbi:MAG TPA: hypothetical protein VI357_15770 [Mycobacteriales bacterium]